MTIKVKIKDVPLYCAITRSKAVLEGRQGVVTCQSQTSLGTAYSVLFDDEDDGVLANPQLNAKMWTFFRDEFDVIEEIKEDVSE